MKNTIDEARETITIRWHGIRKYGENPVIGMRGYPDPNEGGMERYELTFRDGKWEADYFVADVGHGIGYDPIFKLIKRDSNLFAVIAACEHHAYNFYQNMVNPVEEEEA